MQLPSGFPVKVEIPLFHVLNALITFGNVFALETPVTHVTNVEEDDRLTCIIDDECFAVPTNYENRVVDDLHRQGLGFEGEDELLEYAIRQSLVDSGTENEEVCANIDLVMKKLQTYTILGRHLGSSEMSASDYAKLRE